MPYVPSSFEENEAYLLGQGPAPNQQVVTDFPVTSSATAPAESSARSEASIPTATSPQPTPDVGDAAGFQTQGDVGARLFEPLSSGLPQQREAIQSAVNAFYDQAGPSRSYESSGSEGVLSSALGPHDSAESRVQALGQARDVVNAQYEGPDHLNQERAANIGRGLEDLATRARALSSGSGLQTILQRSAPGLTSGEAREEARRYLGDDDFRDRARGYSEDIGRIYEQFAKQQREAQDFARQRSEEEAGIADRSRDYLIGRREQEAQTIRDEIARRQGEQKRVEDAYFDLLESGSLESLGSVPQESLTFDPAAFNTEARQRVIDAGEKFQEIMSRYPEIADIPTIELKIGRGGRERQNTLPREWLEENAGRYTDEELQSITDQALDRHAELREHFAPGTSIKQFRDDGEYALEKPLFFGEDLELPDPRAFVLYDPGSSPSRSNVSTEDQRRIINTVNELIDDLDRIDEGGEPFRAARLAADIEGYLESEELALNEQERQLTAAQKEWRRLARKSRKKYLAAKRKSRWAKIGGILEQVAGSPAPGLFGGGDGEGSLGGGIMADIFA